MKRMLFFFLLMAALASCKNEPADQAATEGETESVTPTRPITPLQEGPLPGSQPISAQTEAAMRFLTNGYWYIEGYFKINAPDEHLANRGRFFKFSPDGKYTSGKLAKATSKGVWSYDPRTALIYLDSENDKEDGEYRIQMGSTGSVMVWIGTERFLQNSIQMKLENYIELMPALPAPSN